MNVFKEMKIMKHLQKFKKKFKTEMSSKIQSRVAAERELKDVENGNNSNKCCHGEIQGSKVSEEPAPRL